MAKREEDVSAYENRSVKIMYMPPSQNVYQARLVSGNTRNSNDIYKKFRMAVNSDFKIDLNDIYLINQKVMQKYKNM